MTGNWYREPWIMRQVWHDLLFAHWPVPVEVLRPLIPSSFEIDTYDGVAWIGVVPFRMSGVRPRAVPAMHWLSAFPELNVRTYVRPPTAQQGRPGVWFFSLDAGNPVAVAIARSVFHLPYFNARMSMTEDRDSFVYRSHRTHRGAPAADLRMSYAPAGDPLAVQPGSLPDWLTSRYCLYTVDGRGRLLRGEINHVLWPLQPAEATFEINTLTSGLSIDLPHQEPLLHFSRELDVVVWRLQRVEMLQ